MKPVYQMVLGESAKREPGLVFSSEDGIPNSQSPVFVLPVPRSVQHYQRRIEYFSEEHFYFPAIYRDEVVNVESETIFPLIRFRVPRTDDYIAFEIPIFPFEGIQFQAVQEGGMDLLRYVGTQRAFAGNEVLYAPLIPDVFAMDDAYRQHEFALVGLTPQFGVLRD